MHVLRHRQLNRTHLLEHEHVVLHCLRLRDFRDGQLVHVSLDVCEDRHLIEQHLLRKGSRGSESEFREVSRAVVRGCAIGSDK